MRTRLAAFVVCTAAASWASADSPVATPAGDVCKVPDNVITGANTHGGALPLFRGDPAHPKMACMVSWSVLSPDGRPLPVQGCFEGKLLQLPNDSACGGHTGPLWVERRWVVTRADKPPVADAKASCQELDTSTVAATRDFRPECLAEKAAAQPKNAGAARATAPVPPDTAAPAQPATPR
jgi:hypothetical protein